MKNADLQKDLYAEFLHRQQHLAQLVGMRAPRRPSPTLRMGMSYRTGSYLLQQGILAHQMMEERIAAIVAALEPGQTVSFVHDEIHISGPAPRREQAEVSTPAHPIERRSAARRARRNDARYWQLFGKLTGRTTRKKQ